ncbi:ABC transporter substrate-binding protein [Acetonema longum]|uniref:Branched chain amino acid abc transporter, amino acid-binding protein n=1 Tax=Acetonema longum DSM 6540 TaxID=1009370 RepID=F7NQC4_9FIRM|nr:branched chain amino acid abc transporter, amino acid-binding protein [Acetonema longum DSM 6540]
MKQWLCGLVAISLLASVAAGCGGKQESGQDAKEIRIGANFEMTGGVAQYGQSAANGIKLAVKEANAAGGILGKQIALIVADNKSEPAESANAATKLITQDKVVALLGPASSSNVLAALSVASDYKVPLLTPTGTNPRITIENGKLKEFAFRSCFIDPFQGTVMANFAAKELMVKTAAIYYDSSSDYSKSLTQVFEESFAKNGGKVLAKEAFLQKDQDFKSALTKLKASNAEVIYIPAYYEEVSKIVKQARELGITSPLLGTDGWDSPKLTEIAGAAALNNTFFSNHYSSQGQDPRVQKFVADYKQEYGQEPDTFAVLGYDGALMLIDAIKRANSTEPVKIKEALAQTRDLQVLTGVLSLDQNHDPVKSAVVVEMKDGKQTFKAKVNP